MVKKLRKIQDYENRQIYVDDLPELESHIKVQKTYENLNEEINHLSKEKDVSPHKFFALLFKYNRKDVIGVFAYIFIESLLKIFSTYCTALLILSVQQNSSTRQLILWSALIIFSNVITVTVGQNGWAKGQRMCAQIRLGLVNILYQKIINMNHYSVQKANTGQIMNVVTSDFNIFETNAIYGFHLYMSPITFTLSFLALYQRLGYFSILAIALLVAIFYLQNLIAKKSAFYSKMKANESDKKVKLFSEMLDGIRIIKIYGWQKAFVEKLKFLRNYEVQCILKSKLVSYLNLAVSSIGPLAICILCFLFKDLFSNKKENTIANIFSTAELSIFISAQVIKSCGIGLNFFHDFKVLLNRQLNIIAIQNQNMIKLSRDSSPEKQKQQNNQSVCHFQDFTMYWDKQKNPILSNISFQIAKGEKISIIGEIGSGKTSLLLSILKEIPFYQGYLHTTNKISYVEQDPFIFQGTLKENVLFGQAFEEQKYKKVLKICSLEQDLQAMKDGDNTFLGEKGSNLSGGQKARVCLARALYTDAELYVFDDFFSALDTKVSSQIFEGVFNDYLKEKSIILATHQLHFAQKCNKILELKNGQICYLNKIEYDVNMNSNQKEEESQQEEKMNVQNEKKEEKTKKVTLKTYINYFLEYKNFSKYLQLSVYFILSEAFFTFFFKSLSFYERNDYSKSYFYLQSFVKLAIYMIFQYLQNAFTAKLCLSINKSIANDIVQRTINAKITTFDNIPQGEIINNFSNDVSILDQGLPDELFSFLFGFFHFFNMIFSISVNNIYFLIPGFLQIPFFLKWFMYIKPILMRSKQLDLENKTPVFTFFKSTINGLIQLRVFNQKEFFIKQINVLMNNNIRTYDIFWFVSRVFSVYLQYMTLFVASIGIFLITYNNSDHQQYAQTLSLLLLLFNFLHISLRSYINVDTFLISYERINHTKDFEQEITKEDNIIAQQKLEPQAGNLNIKNLNLRYSILGPKILKNVSFEVKQGQKVAIVGRTGAGKSSILNALFRMVEIEQNPQSKIEYDGVDIRTVPLSQLRKNIGIISQNPFLFEGTIYENLDLLQQYKESEIIQLLKENGLYDKISSFQKGIHTEIQFCNFSFGQKQLLCLIRVMLKKCPLIVLDEATSSIDFETDKKIQEIIKKKFVENSVITIAHRLNTIADNDLVIVLEKGEVVEKGNPFLLLVESESDNYITNLQGRFAQMVLQTEKENAQNIFELAKEKYFNENQLKK